MATKQGRIPVHKVQNSSTPMRYASTRSQIKALTRNLLQRSAARADDQQSCPDPELGSSQSLSAADRAFFEPRFGRPLDHVRLHTGTEAQESSRGLNARAFTIGSHIAFAKDEYRPGTLSGRKLLAHELTHVIQQGGSNNASHIQRAMKFELQIKKNKMFGWDGASHVWPMPRKYGPADYIEERKSGMRLETETNGQLEFETEWERKLSKLTKQMDDAVAITKTIDGITEEVDIGGERFKKFPGDKADKFDLKHLSKAGWVVPSDKSYESNKTEQIRGVKDSNKNRPKDDPKDFVFKDRPLKGSESLLVKIGDPNWQAYIQISESMEMHQFRDFFQQYALESFDARAPEYDDKGRLQRGSKKTTALPDYKTTVVDVADAILSDVSKSVKTPGNTDNLHGLLQLVVQTVIRGQKPAASPILKPAKYSFDIMSRTHFGSIFAHVLSRQEKRLFRRFVANANRLLLKPLGLTTKTRFFVHGQGSKTNKGTNPRVITWLKSIRNNGDILSSLERPGKISGSMGRRLVNKEKKKHKGLVALEVRKTRGNSAKAADWKSFVETHFKEAMRRRSRPSNKGETGLKL